MREKFYFENISKNCDTIGLFLFFSVILMISHVYYKGVEYCHLIGISLKISYTYELLKKTLLGGGGCYWEGISFHFNYRVSQYIDQKFLRETFEHWLWYRYSLTNCLCQPLFIQLPRGLSVSQTLVIWKTCQNILLSSFVLPIVAKDV